MPFLLLTIKATAAVHRAVELWKQAGRPAIERPFLFADATEQPERHTTNSATGQRTQATEPRPADTRAALGAVRNPQPTWAKIAETGSTRADFQRVGKNGKVAKAVPKATPKTDQSAPRKFVRSDERRVGFVRDGTTPILDNMAGEVASAVNIALHMAGVAGHIRIEKLTRSVRGTISAGATKGADASMLLTHKDTMMQAARKADPGIIDIRTNETWTRIKIHQVPLARYGKPGGLELLRMELEAENPGLVIPLGVRWAGAWQTLEEKWRNGIIQSATAVVAIKDAAIAHDVLQRGGCRAAGTRLKAERYINAGLDAQCSICCEWGHTELRCGALGMARCGFCAGQHKTVDHECKVADCRTHKGKACKHVQAKCANCKGEHFAMSGRCPFKKSAIAGARTETANRS